MSMHCPKKRHSGMSALVVIIILMVLLAYTAVGGMLISEGAGDVSGVLTGERSLFLAEAGLNMSKYALMNNWDQWVDSALFPQQSFASGNFDAAVTDDDDGDGNTLVDSNNRLVITVSGTMGSSTRWVRATIDRYGSALSSAVYAGGDVDTDGNVTGNVIANGSSVPGLDTASAITEAMANHDNGYTSRADGNYFLGDFPSGNEKPTSLNGVMYIDRFSGGNLADVHLSNVSTTSSAPAFLIIIGNVHLSGTVQFDGLIYVGGGGTVDVDVTGSVVISGGIITTGEVDLSGSSTLNYSALNVATSTTISLLTGEGGPTTVSWQEHFP